MRERPILFSAPMVRAILDGRKTQTRRIVKPQQPKPSTMDPYELELTERDGSITAYTIKQFVESRHNRYGVPGDRLWVKESHYFGQWTEERFYNDHDGNSRSTVDWCSPQPGDLDSVAYAADGDPPTDRCERWRKRPSIHMPRWASRITLEVTGVRVERLHAITEEDAKAEGVAPFRHDPEGDCWTAREDVHRSAFEYLWCEINGWHPNAWQPNPFVWVVSFSQVREQVGR